jgi:hypothetical protein
VALGGQETLWPGDIELQENIGVKSSFLTYII